MFKRFLESKLVQALEYMPIVLVRGARQTGKTTLVKSLLSKEDESRYLSFDRVPVLIAAKDDPVGFISRLEKPVILDEIQRVPELFLPIKEDVDNNRVPGRYFLTGSADPLLLPKLGDSLAGRMRLLTMWPLSQGEIEGQKETFLDAVFGNTSIKIGKEFSCSKKDILARARLGGFPAPVLMKNDQQRYEWFTDYISLVLQKDILDLSKIENITQIPHLLMLLASRAGGLLNIEELARTVKLTGMTLNRYLDLLRTLFLVYVVPAWSGNLSKRLVKSPKIYLIDTALMLFALNIDADRLENEPYIIGSVIENFVVLELVKQLSWHDKNIQMYHYRDYQRVEVDIVLEGPGGDLVAIEVKSSESINVDDFKGLKSLQHDVGDKFIQGIVLYTGNVCIPFGDKLTAMPISSLWESIS